MKSPNTAVRALKEGEALKRYEGVGHLRQDRQGRLHEEVGTAGTRRPSRSREDEGVGRAEVLLQDLREDQSD